MGELNTQVHVASVTSTPLLHSWTEPTWSALQQNACADRILTRLKPKVSEPRTGRLVNRIATSAGRGAPSRPARARDVRTHRRRLPLLEAGRGTPPRHLFGAD